MTFAITPAEKSKSKQSVEIFEKNFCFSRLRIIPPATKRIDNHTKEYPLCTQNISPGIIVETIDMKNNNKLKNKNLF